MKIINMRSTADSVEGQGVGACYIEQVDLVKETLSKEFVVKINDRKTGDIHHYHTINLQYYFEILMNKSKVSTIGYVHFLPDTIDDSLKLPKLYKFFFYRYILSFYNSMDYLVVVNPIVIKKLKDYNVTNPKYIYIPNYVANDTFYKKSSEEKDLIRDEYNIPRNKFVVLGVGQLQTRKGVLDFIESARKSPDTTFVWAGGFSFGKMTDGYEEIKEAKKTAPKNLIFLGIVPREKMNDIYNMADLMFLPSFDELFPMSILESISASVPVLLRDVELYKDILFDYYLRGNNVDSFVAIIEKLKTNESYYNEYVNKSIDCNNFYSKAKTIEKWQEMYTDAANLSDIKNYKKIRKSEKKKLKYVNK